jgi:hypothetical protein
MQTIGNSHFLVSRVNTSSCRTILVVGTLVGDQWTIAFSNLKCGNCCNCLRVRSGVKRAIVNRIALPYPEPEDGLQCEISVQ